MNTLEKFFNSIKNAPSLELKGFTTRELIRQLPEYDDHILYILKSIYSLLTSENTSDRICGVRILGHMDNFEYKTDFVVGSKTTDFVYLQCKDIAEVESASKEKQQISLKKKLKLEHTDSKFLEALDYRVNVVHRVFKTQDIVEKSIENIYDFFEAITVLLLSPEWYKRHGAFLAHCAMLAPSHRVLEDSLCSMTDEPRRIGFDSSESEPNNESSTSNFTVVDKINNVSDGVNVGNISKSKHTNNANNTCNTSNIANNTCNNINTCSNINTNNPNSTCNTSNTSNATNTNNNTNNKTTNITTPRNRIVIHVEKNLFNIIFEMLKNDKFNDFIDNKTSAPVREAASLLLRFIFPTIKNTDTLLVISSLLKSSDWQEKFSGLLALSFIKDFITDSLDVFTQDLLPLIESSDEDIKYLSAELLSFLIEVGSFDASFAQTLSEKCWEQINDEVDIAHSKASILVLLRTIYSKYKIQSTDSFSSLYPCFTSSVQLIRFSVLELSSIFDNEEFSYLLAESILLSTDLECRRRAAEILRSRISTTGFYDFGTHFHRIISLDLFEPYHEDDFACFDENFFTKDGIKSIGYELVLENRTVLFDVLCSIPEYSTVQESKTYAGVVFNTLREYSSIKGLVASNLNDNGNDNNVNVLVGSNLNDNNNVAGSIKVNDNDCNKNVGNDDDNVRNENCSINDIFSKNDNNITVQSLGEIAVENIAKEFKNYPCNRKLPIAEFKSIFSDPFYNSLFPMVNERAQEYIRVVACKNIENFVDFSIYFMNESCEGFLRTFCRFLKLADFNYFIKIAYERLVEAAKKLSNSENNCGYDGTVSSVSEKSNCRVSDNNSGKNSENNDGKNSGYKDVTVNVKSSGNKGDKVNVKSSGNKGDKVGENNNEKVGDKKKVRQNSRDKKVNNDNISNTGFSKKNEGKLNNQVQNDCNLKYQRILKNFTIFFEIIGDSITNSGIFNYFLHEKDRKFFFENTVKFYLNFGGIKKIFDEALVAKNSKILKEFIRIIRYNELIVLHLLDEFDCILLSDILEYSHPCFNILFTKLVLKNIGHPQSHFLLSRILLSINFTVNENVSEELRRMIEKEKKDVEMIVNPSMIEEYELVVEPAVVLREYQKEGIKWLSFLHRFGLNGILADDMGLGKTIQVLSYMISEQHKLKMMNESTSEQVCMGEGPCGAESTRGETQTVSFDGYASSADSIACGKNISQADTVDNIKDVKPISINNRAEIPKFSSLHLTMSDDPTKCLIVCPTSLTAHWKDEIKKYYNLESIVYDNKIKSIGADIIISTYDSIRKDTGTLLGTQWFMVVIDEGHLLKNRSTVLYDHVSKIISKRKVILTGTPIMNSIDDLFSLFNIIMPGYLGSEQEFMKAYNCKITDKNVQEMEDRLNALHKKILPFIMRRLKKEVLKDLPEKIIRDLNVEMNHSHQVLYKKIEEDELRPEEQAFSEMFKDGLFKQSAENKVEKSISDKGILNDTNIGENKTVRNENEDKSKDDAIENKNQSVNNEAKSKDIPADEKTAVENDKNTAAEAEQQDSYATLKKRNFSQTRNLLKAASNPKHFDQSIPSSKTAALSEIFSICGENKILIFFQFKKTIDFVIEEMKLTNYLRLDGSIPPAQRGAVVSKFHNENIPYLFLTTSIGGLGLNLTCADTVVFYEHDWNPFNDLQAMDRAHRLGQKNTVNVFRLICKGTIEEKVMNYQNFKMYLANSIVTQQNTNIEEMDTKNLLERFES